MSTWIPFDPLLSDEGVRYPILTVDCKNGNFSSCVSFSKVNTGDQDQIAALVKLTELRVFPPKHFIQFPFCHEFQRRNFISRDLTSPDLGNSMNNRKPAWWQSCLRRLRWGYAPAALFHWRVRFAQQRSHLLCLEQIYIGTC